jgi:hypothetical protein
MPDILYPTKTRRFMSEVARRAQVSPQRGARRIRCTRRRLLGRRVQGWSCNPDRVANFFATVERQVRVA